MEGAESEEQDEVASLWDRISEPARKEEPQSTAKLLREMHSRERSLRQMNAEHMERSAPFDKPTLPLTVDGAAGSRTWSRPWHSPKPTWSIRSRLGSRTPRLLWSPCNRCH
jgi:hypothetical protein